jgi:hypothetical protein
LVPSFDLGSPKRLVASFDQVQKDIQLHGIVNGLLLSTTTNPPNEISTILDDFLKKAEQYTFSWISDKNRFRVGNLVKSKLCWPLGFRSPGDSAVPQIAVKNFPITVAQHPTKQTSPPVVSGTCNCEENKFMAFQNNGQQIKVLAVVNVVTLLDQLSRLGLHTLESTIFQ